MIWKWGFCITLFAAGLIPCSVAQQQIPISSVTGLQNELDVLVPIGPGYVPLRAAVINSEGALDAVTGNPGDCVHVDGSSGPCGATVIAETPGGVTNGSNITFTLASTPTATQPVEVFLNGMLETAGLDYTLSGKTISFGAAPATGDLVRVYYTSTQQGRSVRPETSDDFDVRKIAFQALSREAPSPASENGSRARGTVAPSNEGRESTSKPFRSLGFLNTLIKERNQPDSDGFDLLLKGADVSHRPRRVMGGTDAAILRAFGEKPSDAASKVVNDPGFDDRAIVKSYAAELPLRSIRLLREHLSNVLGF